MPLIARNCESTVDVPVHARVSRSDDDVFPFYLRKIIQTCLNCLIEWWLRRCLTKVELNSIHVGLFAFMITTAITVIKRGEEESS